VTEFPAIQSQAAVNTTAQAQQMVQLARFPLIDQVPGWVSPHIGLGFRDGLGLTDVAFLRDARSRGALPTDLPVWEAYNRQVPVRLGFVKTGEPVPPEADCQEQVAPVTIDGRPGEQVGLVGGVLTNRPTVRVAMAQDPDVSVEFAARVPTRFQITVPATYVLSSSDPQRPFLLCRW
jgi:hypothetical protein